jgi:hypothetical protein
VKEHLLQYKEIAAIRQAMSWGNKSLDECSFTTADVKEKLVPLMADRVPMYKRIFNIRSKITSIETKAHCLLFLNSIYESWSGYKHYQTDKENSRKDKKVITTYKYGFKAGGDMADTKVYSMIAKAK